MFSVFKNRVLTKIYGCKNEEETVYHDKLHYLHSSSVIVRVMKSRGLRWVGHRALDGKPERSREKSRQYNIKIVLEEMGWMSIKQTHLDQDCNKWQALVSWDSAQYIYHAPLK